MRESKELTALRHFCAGGDVGHGGDNDDLGAIFVGGGEEHTLAFFAAHGARGEVGHDDNGFADEGFGFVVGADAGDDLALFGAEVDFQYEQPVGVGVRFGFEDAGDAEVDLGEVVEGDCCWDGRGLVAHDAGRVERGGLFDKARWGAMMRR